MTFVGICSLANLSLFGFVILTDFLKNIQYALLLLAQVDRTTAPNRNFILIENFLFCIAGLPYFSSQPESVSVHPGGNEVLICEVSADLAPFTHWQKNGQAVEMDTRLMKLPHAALVISNASQADAGVYRCIIEGLGPAKTSQDAQLELLLGNKMCL